MQDMVALSEFIPLISPEVPGAIKPVIQSKVALSLSRYFRETTAWRELTQVELIPDYDAEILLPYDDVVVGGIVRAVVGDTQIPEGDLIRNSPAHVRYSCSEKSILTMDVYLVNTMQITDMPKSLFNAHGSVIVDGAKAALMMMPNTPWFNPQLAAHYKKEFEGELLRIGYEVRNGFNGDPVSRTKKPISFYI